MARQYFKALHAEIGDPEGAQQRLEPESLVLSVDEPMQPGKLLPAAG